MQITKKQSLARYNCRYRVSVLRQWWFGSSTAFREHSIKPCPRCHGNDRIESLAEAPGFVHVCCHRCNLDYIA